VVANQYSLEHSKNYIYFTSMIIIDYSHF